MSAEPEARIVAIDHVQLAMPRGAEDKGLAFYGELLGMREIEKPAALHGRGGLWMTSGAVEIHLGVEDDFRPARKAHPGLVVSRLDDLARSLRAAGHDAMYDDAIPGRRRFFTSDPFGNRIEFMEARDDV